MKRNKTKKSCIKRFILKFIFLNKWNSLKKHKRLYKSKNTPLKKELI